MEFKRFTQITEYWYLKINYESKVTWKQATDYLRCSENFHGRPRYDFVIVQTVEKRIFVQLIYIFTVTVSKVKYPLALVQPFNALVPNDTVEKDRDLGLIHVCTQARDKSKIIPVALIIRSAVLVKDLSVNMENDYLVMDIIDGDMFLRVKEMYL